MKNTQNNKILVDLVNGKRISQKTAIKDYNCYRLSARIFNLRNSPNKWNIKTTLKGGFATYFWEG